MKRWAGKALFFIGSLYHLQNWCGQYTPGTLDTNFKDQGYLNLSSLAGSVADQNVQRVVVLADGRQYLGFDGGALIRLTSDGQLDVTYGPMQDGYGVNCPSGISAMISDQLGTLYVAGNTGPGYIDRGWVAVYANDNTGSFDSNFNHGRPYFLPQGSKIKQIVQQSMGRILVVGENFNTGNGAIWALTNQGQIDTTFNADKTPGYYEVFDTHLISNIITDQYDRIIYTTYTYLAVDITRLTSSGQLDTTFGNFNSGIISSALVNIDDAEQVRCAFDQLGNIIIAAHTMTDEKYNIRLIAFENGPGEIIVYGPIVTFPDDVVDQVSLSGLVCSDEGSIFLSGQITDNISNPLWVASFIHNNGAIELNTTFAPNAPIAGIMYYANYAPTNNIVRLSSDIAIYPYMYLSLIGYEIYENHRYSFLARAYGSLQGMSQNKICNFAQPIGTNDRTFGCAGNIGTIFALYGTDLTLSQSAQAIALQDDQTIVVAGQGQAAQNGKSSIFLNAFNVDGLLQQKFNPNILSPGIPGQALVLDTFDDQYVNDMLVYQALDGSYKALLAGFVCNNRLRATNSFILQYDLNAQSPGVDSSFGGYSGDIPGVTVGLVNSKAYAIMQQSMGRIILAGQIFASNYSQGFLQAYTSQGRIDTTFANQGCLYQAATGIYSAVIDSQDRIVTVYVDGTTGISIVRILPDGSGIDDSFNHNGPIPGMYTFTNIPGLVLSDQCKIIIDSLGNILVAAIIDQSILIMIHLDSQGNLIGSYQFDHQFGLHNFTMTDFLVTTTIEQDKESIIVIGYDQALQDAHSDIIICCTLSNNLITPNLDFNNQCTPGYLYYQIDQASLQQSGKAVIHPDGRIIVTHCLGFE